MMKTVEAMAPFGPFTEMERHYMALADLYGQHWGWAMEERAHYEQGLRDAIAFLRTKSARTDADFDQLVGHLETVLAFRSSYGEPKA